MYFKWKSKECFFSSFHARRLKSLEQFEDKVYLILSNKYMQCMCNSEELSKIVYNSFTCIYSKHLFPQDRQFYYTCCKWLGQFFF